VSDVNDVVIIGGGVTGLSAGLYAMRSKLKTTLVERMITGGQIINADVIENYPGFPNGISGPDLVAAVEEQASKFGLDYGFGEVTQIDASRRPMVVRTEDEEYQARAIIIAGGGDHVKLGVPGEEEFEARGVSYCATCDGNFFIDQEVAVVGGGDSAVEDADYLTRICSKVTLIHRRDRLRASPILQERFFQNPKVELLGDTVIDAIKGDGQVHSLSLHNVKTEEKRDLTTAAIFVYIGFNPASAPYQGLLDMDSGGHIKVDLKMATNVPGIFAAGDIRWQSTRQLANAAGDGVTAALAAYEYLGEN
jgi:thioredoxin reductase (NADPH)